MRLSRLLSFDRLDRYAVRQLAAPFMLSLAALLLATLLGRLLRLFDLAASTGVALLSVGTMAANLVPHYLGLALPMAFTAGIFAATARMGEDNELDVMLSAGRSIGRIAVPYFVLGILLSVFNLYLFGQLQPMSRYAYHVVVDQAVRTTWDARLEETKFIATDHGFSFSADSIAGDNRHMTGVFIQRRSPESEEVTTAIGGLLVPAAKGPGQVLHLDHGVTLSQAIDGTVSVTHFEDGYVVDLPPAFQPFRPRGDDVNELTLAELRTAMHRPAAAASAPAGAATEAARAAASPPASGKRATKASTEPAAEAAAEFHGRLARALLPPLLPLMALPLGIASRRARRAPGVIFAGLALLVLHHALQFGESLAANGRVPAAAGLWIPYAAFGLLSLRIFFGSLAWPGDNPVSRAVATIESLIDRVLARLLPRRREVRAA